jgi:phosphatidylserine decarboxylase
VGVRLLVMKDALIVHFLALLPRRRISRGMGFFARIRLPAWFNQLVLRLYAWWYGVNTDEMVGEFSDYTSLDAFFTRPLIEGARPISPGPDCLVSPVDGRVLLVESVGESGVGLPGGQLCNIHKLLGENELPGPLDVAIIYLAPPDYHRVHHCCDGQVLRASYQPGRLWPVFPGAVRRVAELFEKNERLVTSGINSTGVPWASIMVGAFGVGRISTTFWDLVTNAGMPGPSVFEPPAPISITKGEELGRFHLGSTVVLVFPSGRVRWEIEAGQVLRMGERIGVWTEKLKN